MTKTAVATKEPDDRKKKHICPICGAEMKYSRKLRKWICEECLHGAYLTDQAQRAAVKRYRQTEKGKKSERKYELSEKGKKARERYLKSDKYKQRRREYNQRLKESLDIARKALAGQPRAKAQTREERLVPLVDEIKEFIQMSKHPPKPQDVIEWAEETHSTKISHEEASNLIGRARKELVT